MYYNLCARVCLFVVVIKCVLVESILRLLDKRRENYEVLQKFTTWRPTWGDKRYLASRGSYV